MTDINALVAELRKRIDACDLMAAWNLMDQAADALEELKANRDEWASRMMELASITQERDDLETRLSEYLCDSTGGLLSKTGYDVRTMVAHTTDYYASLHAEERVYAESDRDRYRAAIEQAVKDLEEVLWPSSVRVILALRAALEDKTPNQAKEKTA